MTLTFGNSPEIKGRDNIISAFSDMLDKVVSLGHDLVNVWEEEGGVVFFEDIGRWTLRGGAVIEIKAASKITVVDGKFVDQRIYVDNAPLFEALEREKELVRRDRTGCGDTCVPVRGYRWCRAGTSQDRARISEGLVEAPLLRRSSPTRLVRQKVQFVQHGKDQHDGWRTSRVSVTPDRHRPGRRRQVNVRRPTARRPTGSSPTATPGTTCGRRRKCRRR